MNRLRQQPLWSQRLLAWGLLLGLLLALGYLFAGFYLQPLQSELEDRRRQAEKAQRVEAILAREGQIAETAQRLQALGLNRLFLPEQSASTAASALQNRIKRLVTAQSGAKIQAIKPFPAEEKAGYAELSLEIRMIGLSHAGLQRVLHGIETSLPALVIKRISIKRAVNRYKPVVRPDNRDARLAVTLVVSGYFRPGGEVAS